MTCRPPNYRCAATSCERCARRYASRLTRRILSIHPHRLHRVQFATTFSVCEFHNFRIRARNAIDHYRRENRWMREVSLFSWLGRNGSVSGVVALNSVQAPEFTRALQWAYPTLTAIPPDELRKNVLNAMRPNVIAGDEESRYQRVKFSITPQRSVLRSSSPCLPVEEMYVESMPVIV